MFQSDFGFIADFFVQKRLTGDYCPPNSMPVKHMDAFLKLLSIMVGDQRYREILDEMNLNNKGESNMCEVFDKIEQRGVQKGIREGIREGVISLYKKGLITVSDAAKELNVSEKEFVKLASE